MKKVLKRIFGYITLAVCFMVLIACSNKEKNLQSDLTDSPEREQIRIATLSTFEPMIGWIEEGLKPMGYDIEIVMFDSNNLPAIALKDGDVDGLIHNHLPWINIFNQENNCDLIMPEPYITYGPMAVYSSKYKTIDEIPQNGQIAVMGDTANIDRSLVVLSDVGLITLGEKTDQFYTMLDIEENPKNIKLIETESASTVRSIDDVDAIIVYANRMKMANLDPNSFIYEDPISKDYPQSLVVNPKDIGEQWIKDLLQYVETEEFKKKFNEHYDGTYILYNN